MNNFIDKLINNTLKYRYIVITCIALIHLLLLSSGDYYVLKNMTFRSLESVFLVITFSIITYLISDVFNIPNFLRVTVIGVTVYIIYCEVMKFYTLFTTEGLPKTITDTSIDLTVGVIIIIMLILATIHEVRKRRVHMYVPYEGNEKADVSIYFVACLFSLIFLFGVFMFSMFLTLIFFFTGGV